MATARQRRGRRRAKDLADRWFKLHGWPFAEAREGSAPGRDITGMPGLAPEVKARADYDPTGWLRQADNNAQRADPMDGHVYRDLPFVVHCPNGYGPARLPEWVVSIRLDDFTNLLRDAGYGDPR